MKKRTFLLIFLLFLYLLLCPEAAAASARDGLLLWYHSVIPVLLPFMLLCGIVIRQSSQSMLPRFIRYPLQRFFGCSADGAFAICAGFLCGFPMGAKITSDLYRQNRIRREEACFLYGFTNNLSPAFLMSYLAAEQLHRPELRFAVLFTVLGSAMLYGCCTSILHHRRSLSADAKTDDNMISQRPSASLSAIIDASILDTARSAVRLAVYIMCFSILSGAVMQSGRCTHPLPLFAVSCIEVTNGIRLLASAALPFQLKYILINALAAFGGLSALAQTAGIAALDHDCLLYYIKSRVIITLLSAALAAGSLLFFVFAV